MDSNEIKLKLRSMVFNRSPEGCAGWLEATRTVSVKACETAIIICDMWDDHCSKGAAIRTDKMAPYMNEVVSSARRKGVHIIHAPSDTMDYYEDTPARMRVKNAPFVPLPEPMEHIDPALPFIDPDFPSDTGETNEDVKIVWKCQNKALDIDQDKDGVSDKGQEIYNYFYQAGIKNVIMMGVHTNICVLHRTFGIKNLVRWGFNTFLARDLTDSMFNPEKPPYVNHEEGTRLVVEFIEKFWCPTILSRDLME